MATIALPGLDGRVPLGFLAALGLLHLIDTQHPPAQARLSWDPATCHPLLHTDSWSTAQDVADWLVELATALPAWQLLPGLPPGFPPSGAAPDALVPGLTEFAALRQTLPESAQQILGALVTDLATNNEGRVRRTPMVAPTGKQSFHTLFRNQHDYIRAQPHRLREALLGWRRAPGCVGEGFDHAAIIGGADDPQGKPGERAVPGATWLAIAGLPAYRLAIDTFGRTSATTWRRIDRTMFLYWPLWTPRLPLAAVRVLLEHPATTRGTEANAGIVTVQNESLAELGVFRLCAARRRPTGNSDGPLVPVQVVRK